MSWRAPALAALVAGCGAREAVHTAQICVGVEDELGGFDSVEIVGGDTLVLQAIATFGCHSTDHAVACTVTESAPGELVVTTLTTWTRTEPLAMGCEEMLYRALGTCETPPLPEGAWVLRFGDRALAFDVPGDAGGCLLGDGLVP